MTGTSRWTATTVLLAALAVALGWNGTGALARDAGRDPGAGAPSNISLVEAGEPGTPLIVTGTVFAPDGETPAPGVTLYVYQTDLTGRYAPSGRVPRLRGWMTTDAEGRYEYRTIRPASYPGTEIAAHVHTQLWGGGWPRQWNRDLLFADDPFLNARQRRESESAGRFASICDPEVDPDGTLHCVHDLRLKPEPDRFDPVADHGSIPPRDEPERSAPGQR
jgi:protocatechuate 3,4-dioxygenase beta subunit